MVDESRILHKLRFITSALSRLDELAQMDKDVFLADFRSVDSAKYNLQVSIEAMIDICNHVISRKRLRVPSSNAESFDIVSEAGLLPPEARSAYREMARFRNRIIHMYDQVDDSQIYEILQSRLGDIRAFVEFITSTRWA